MNFTKDDLARFDPNISASLVYVSGDKSIRIPSICGTPREDQLQGTPYEQLCELAGRACYASLSKGRNSADYHEHLIESKHWSVYEHAWFVVSLNGLQLRRRPSLLDVISDLRQVRCKSYCGGELISMTFNVRHFLDLCTKKKFNHDIGRYLATDMVRGPIGTSFPSVASVYPYGDIGPLDGHAGAPWENPFVSLYLSCSRNASHEQVRHRFAVSQRSTRYCDETDTPFVVHPHDKTDACDLLVRADRCRNDYSESLNSSTKWLGEYNGLGSTTARKQARGAARGYLPSNLATQMMFTADVSEWAHMLRMRMTNDADAEIRVLYNHILLELSKHPDTKKLSEVRTVEAEDGAGFVIDPTDKLLDGIADG